MIKLDRTLEYSSKSYIAVAEGSEQHNMAKVYAGTYIHGKHEVPIVVIVKCGTKDERKHSKKPGNRGKRDSQIILLNALSRIVFNDRMTPLDYDIAYKSKKVAGLSLDLYDFVLMVDADTIVHPSSLKFMIRAMNNDSSIMGLCGETKVSNKLGSWVTMIQV
jgi:chitin synthase